ncbi:MAG: class I SAM-dependent methyltransferase, partial [Polyangiaceae bacterium]
MELPRIQAFELNDASWAPEVVREMVVETLSRTLRWGRVLHELVPPFARFLSASGASEVLDLCAGAAGPATILASEMARAGHVPPRFLLTDLYPRVEAWEEARAEHPAHIDFVREPVDATQIPEELASGRARTIINALHHFPPALVSAIFADAVRGSRGIFVAEAFE